MAEQFNLYTTLKHPERKRELSPIRKRKLHMRIFYSVVLLISLLLQNTPHLFPTIMGSHAFLLLPLTVCICLFEKDLSACVFGVIAGVLWDISTAWGDGFYALFFLVVSTVLCLLMTYVLRNNMGTALILSLLVILLYCAVHWLIFVVARGEPGKGILFATFYLPSAAYSFVFTPIYYALIRWYRNKLRKKYPKKEILEDRP